MNMYAAVATDDRTYLLFCYRLHKTEKYVSILGAVKISEPDTSDKNVEDAVKIWLKHAPQRMKKSGR